MGGELSKSHVDDLLDIHQENKTDMMDTVPPIVRETSVIINDQICTWAERFLGEGIACALSIAVYFN
jgi:hypothetical protein